MTVNILTHSVESPEVTEIYISAVPIESASPQKHAEEIFSGISNILLSKKAHIFQERVFAAQYAMEIVGHARSQAYAGLDDGVAPSFLAAKEGLLGPIAGVQVHAIICENKPNSNPIKACPERIEFTLSVIEGNGPISSKAKMSLKSHHHPDNTCCIRKTRRII